MILHNAIAAQNESIQILPVCLWEFDENFKHLPKIAVQKCKSGNAAGDKNEQQFFKLLRPPADLD